MVTVLNATNRLDVTNIAGIFSGLGSRLPGNIVSVITDDTLSLATLVRGGMGEWLKPAVLKTVCGETRTGVRIPLPPPESMT